MNESLLPLLIPVVVVLVIAIAAAAWYVEKKRREALQAFAAERGWTYVRRDDSWARAFDGRPFRSGHDREDHHVFRGKHDGRDFVGFEFVYHTTENSDSNAGTSSREVEVSGAVHQLAAVAEGYPELRASSNYLHLQKELRHTEDRIAAGRRFYNGNVRDLNTRVRSFPSNLVAATFGFAEREFFELADPAASIPPGLAR